MTDANLGERIIAEWRLARWERRIMEAMRRALAEHQRHALEAARQALTAAGPVDPMDAAVWTDTVGRTLEPVLHSVFAEITQTTLKGFYDDPAAYPVVDLTRNLDRMLGHMNGLGPWMSDRLGKTLHEGFNAGEGWDKLERRVREAFFVGEHRAERIARTETVGAANGASFDLARVMRQGGIPIQKEWLATRDRRTRASHRTADGQRRLMDDPFRVGSCELMRPHDFAVTTCPQEIVNCRCTLIYPPLEPTPQPKPVKPKTTAKRAPKAKPAVPTKQGVSPEKFLADPRNTKGATLGKTTKLFKEVDIGRKAIAKVHRAPAAMLRRPFTIRQSRPKTGAGGGQTMGSFNPYSGIELLPTGDHVAMTLAHEFGHLFDYFNWGTNKSDYTSARWSTAGNPLRDFLRTAWASPRYDQWRSLQAGETVEMNGRRVRMPVAFMDYLLDPLEVWARAYSQFIAVESGDPTLLRQLRAKQATPFSDQWPDAEFEPIRDAIRAAFRAEGLMD